jgi:hypothetical protein
MSKEFINIDKGIARMKQDNGFTVLRLHYSADPDRNEEWVKREKASYPYLELWQQEMELDFISTAGKRVYPEFSMERNVADIKPERFTEIWRGWDFGYTHPAVVWTQRTHDGHFHVLASITGTDTTIQRFAREVLDVSDKLFPGYKFKDAGDPACRQHNDKSEQTTADTLRILYGIRMQSRPTRVADGIRLIRTMLMPRADGFVRMKVDKSNELLIDAMLGGYVRDDDDDPIKDGFYDHICDALRYVSVILFDMRTADPIKAAKPVYRERPTASPVTGY